VRVYPAVPEGEGTKVSLSNITWCTEEMYRVALSPRASTMWRR
jgi:uncharacterized protein YpuA (DUF1002 family)